jgi:mono/diheme cytochrome c family protein
MNPRPRDFTRATYRLRSTPTGSLPTDADLFRTISRGIPGTAMPSWSGLSVADRWQIVHYIKSLSPRFKNERPERPLYVPPTPRFSPLSLRRGRAIYRLMQCAECHGESGRGDGPAASTMEDDQGQPIYAFDFTRGWKLKNGRRVRDIYQVLATGLDGTPMPSYAETLAPSDIWDLAYYVRSLFVDQEVRF